MGLATMVLVDTLARWPDAEALYSDGGVLSRADVAQLYGFLHADGVSVWMAGGSTAFAWCLFGVQLACALALLVGWRSRWMAALLWALLSGLQLRNLYVGAGFDALLRLLLLWSVFVPLDRRLALFSRSDDRTPVMTVGVLGLVTQALVIYLQSGWAKWEVPAWRSGEALALQLQSDWFSTGLGRWLCNQEGLCHAITLVTPWLEMCWPLAFLIPVARGPIRTATLVVVAAFTLSIGACLAVDLFPVMGVLALVPLLPAWFWERMEAHQVWGRVSQAIERPTTLLRARLPEPVPARMGWLSQGLGAGILAWTLVWHVGVTVDPQYPGPQIGGAFGRTLFLQQSYRMFARPAERTGWLEVEGRMLDGRAVDLLRDGGPAPRARADEADTHVGRREPRNFRWGQIFRKMAYGALPNGPLQYSRYLCREWNATRSAGARLDTLEIRFQYRRQEAGVGAGYSTEVLWQHGCFR